MRKIINDPGAFVDEVLDGIVRAHPGAYRFASDDHRAIVDAAAPRAGIVGIVTGGGSGHLPLFLGYVGPGLATGVAVGNVFSSPSPEQILQATRAVDGDAGVLYLYGNYGGDVYNFDLAAEMARAEGIESQTVLGTDDILSARVEAAQTRRGVAGLVLAMKIAGASAARGDDLPAVARLAAHCISQTRTVGVGLAPTILPAAGQPTFHLDEGQMEIGIGIHGEAGLATVSLETADQIAARFVLHLSTEVELTRGTRVAVLVNGLGATPLEELYLLFREVHRLTSRSGAVVARAYVGNYATSLEMAGASVSVLVLDDKLEELLGLPGSSPFYREGTVAATGDPPAVHRPPVGASRSGYPELPLRDFACAVLPAVRAVAVKWPDHAEELRDLDAGLGDGDLGITVSAGCRAVVARLDKLPVNVAASVVLRESGLAFASANPSTFAALVGGGLVSASSELDDSHQITVSDSVATGRAIADFVTRKGGAERGDKTLLDVLLPVLDALDESPDDLDRAVSVAWEQVATTAGLRSRRGRAAWHQDRSIGLKDPGAVAIAYALEALLRGVERTRSVSGRSRTEPWPAE